MDQITKTEFLARIEKGLIEWPPVSIGTKLYGRVEGKPYEVVWCNV